MVSRPSGPRARDDRGLLPDLGGPAGRRLRPSASWRRPSTERGPGQGLLVRRGQTGRFRRLHRRRADAPRCSSTRRWWSASSCAAPRGTRPGPGGPCARACVRSPAPSRPGRTRAPRRCPRAGPRPPTRRARSTPTWPWRRPSRRGRGACAPAGLIALGAGAGLVGTDLRCVRGVDVVARSGGLVVIVGGKKARVVPVLARYHDLLCESAAFAGAHYVVGGHDPRRHNVTTPLISSLAGGVGPRSPRRRAAPGQLAHELCRGDRPVLLHDRGRAHLARNGWVTWRPRHRRAAKHRSWRSWGAALE